METFELAPTLWSDYFETVTREQAGSVTLVRAGFGAGAPGRSGSARARRLRAISFDAGRRVVEIDVGAPSAARPAIRYFIERPQRIAASQGGGLRCILIVGANGLRTLVWLERIPASQAPSGPADPIGAPRRRTYPAGRIWRAPSRSRAQVFGQRRCPCAR